MSFRFHLQGASVALVDWANVYHWFLGRGKEITVENLAALLKKNGLSRMVLFHGRDESEADSREFLHRAARAGLRCAPSP